MIATLELPARPLTLDDVAQLAEGDEFHRFELSEGNLVVVPPATWDHQKVCADMAVWLMANGHQGRVNIAVGLQTAGDNLNGRVPDVVVASGPVPGDTVWLPPGLVALAVEIVSKGSERADRWFKPLEYAEVGIPWFWRVEPDETVVRFHLEDGQYVEVGRAALDELLASDVPDLS